MNSTEVSQSAGGGQRAREASVGKPSLPRLYSGIFSLDGFDNGLDGGRCLGSGNQVMEEWRRRWAVCVCEPSLTGLKLGGCRSRLQKDTWGGEKEVYGQDQREAPLVVLVGDRCHLQIELQVGVGSWKPSVTTEVS